MDLALNNLQRLICLKTQPTNLICLMYTDCDEKVFWQKLNISIHKSIMNETLIFLKLIFSVRFQYRYSDTQFSMTDRQLLVIWKSSFSAKISPALAWSQMFTVTKDILKLIILNGTVTLTSDILLFYEVCSKSNEIKAVFIKTEINYEQQIYLPPGNCLHSIHAGWVVAYWTLSLRGLLSQVSCYKGVASIARCLRLN